jgi:hypothetical protein
MRYDLGLGRTERGPRIMIGREIPAPAAVVYNIMASVEHWAAWGPPVRAVDYDHETVTAGTTGRVLALGLYWVPFRIDSVTDSAWVWRVWEQTPPADGHRVEEVGDERSRAVLEVPLWAVWYLPLCALALWNIGSLAETSDEATDRATPD